MNCAKTSVYLVSRNMTGRALTLEYDSMGDAATARDPRFAQNSILAELAAKTNSLQAPPLS